MYCFGKEGVEDCNVLNPEGQRVYRRFCGTMKCPFYKPKGDELKVARIGRGFKEYTEKQKDQFDYRGEW